MGDRQSATNPISGPLPEGTEAAEAAGDPRRPQKTAEVTLKNLCGRCGRRKC